MENFLDRRGLRAEGLRFGFGVWLAVESSGRRASSRAFGAITAQEFRASNGFTSKECTGLRLPKKCSGRRRLGAPRVQNGTMGQQRPNA